MQNEPKHSQIRRLISDIEKEYTSQNASLIERFNYMVDLCDQEASSLHEQVTEQDSIPVIKRRFPPLFSL